LLTFLSQLYFKSNAMLFHSQGTVDPLVAWVNQVLRPQRVTVSNWHSQWNDGVAIYSLLALLWPDVLSLDDVSNFSSYERAEKVITALRELNIPIIASEPHNWTLAKSGSNLIHMQVQEIYNAIMAPSKPKPSEPPPEPVPEPDLLPPQPVPQKLQPSADFHDSLDGTATYSLGIDFGSSKVRFSVFSTKDPNSVLVTSHVRVGLDGSVDIESFSPDFIPFRRYCGSSAAISTTQRLPPP
jgi:hypothetical protein